MPYGHSSPYFQMDNPAKLSLLRPTPKDKHRNSSSTSSTGAGGFLRMFKFFPMLTSGCKMAALLGKPRKPLLKDGIMTVTIFGYRKSRVWLAIQDNPYCMPMFVIELPMLTSVLRKEMGSDIVRIALESETRTHKKKLFEEFVWAVYCNGRKMGYSIRRKQVCEDELHVMQLLRGVSMGAGVIPSPNDKENGANGELTYMRATFERVVGSKDSEALYLINPDGAPSPELCIFFIRGH